MAIWAVLWETAPNILTPIKENIFEKYLYTKNITIADNIAPEILYIKLETLPVTNIRTILFKTLTVKASLNPKIIRVTNITILDSPSLAPGIGMGNGMEDSIRDKAKPIDTNKDKNIILLVFFMGTSHSSD